MRGPLRLLVRSVVVLALFAGPLGAAEPKGGAKAPPPQKPPTAAPLAEGSGTHKVKREPLKVELTLRGTFEPEQSAEIVFRPAVWTTLEVVKAVEHGQAVKKGDVLVQCEAEKIDDEIADLRAKLAISDLSLKQAEENLRMLETSTPLDLQLAERSRRNAAEDLARFLKIDRLLSEKIANFMVKMSENSLEYEREELRQLEKMYKADELTDETEEIVLKRQRNAVESAEFMLERSRASRDETLQIELPRRQETFEQNDQRQELQAARAKATLPVALEQARRELAKVKLERGKDETRHKKLLADREGLTVRAPRDGVVYYGRFVRGKWSGMETIAESLRGGGTIVKNTAVMTIVSPRPMFVRAAVGEADLEKIRPGLSGTARPTAFPELKLPATVARVEGIPSASESFDVRIDVRIDAGDKRQAALVPGMACAVKLVSYLDKRALVVPSQGVFAEELDEDSRYVFLVGKDGRPQKRPVTIGRRSGDKTEILRGVAEGDEVLLEKPKEKSAGEAPQAKPAEKKDVPQSPASATPKKEPASEAPKKPEPAKKAPK